MRCSLFATLALFLLPGIAAAHKLDIAVTLPATEPTVIKVVVGYDDGTPAEEATVTLTGEGIETRSTTDETGTVRLARPGPGVYIITADDGAGHKSRVQLEIPAEPTTEDIQVDTALANKPLRTALGLLAIALLTGIGWWLTRRGKSRE